MIDKIIIREFSEDECIDCGACCYFPDNIGLKGDCGKIMIGDDGFCIHHKKGTGCEIYDERPIQCRLLVRGGEMCLGFRKLLNKKRNVV